MRLGDKVRFIEGFYHSGNIVCLDPLTVRTKDGEEVKANLNNIELYEPQQFITSRGRHNKGQRHQLSNELENK